MEITTPSVLKALSTGSTAIQSMMSWMKQSKGDSRTLIAELKENLLYLDMVANDDIQIEMIIDKLSMTEFKRLSKQGFDFNKLQRRKIEKYPSLQGSDLANWGGKSTEELIFNIFDKINQLTIQYPLVAQNPKYRWSIRINNIRKRIWLLLKHIEQT